MESTPNQDVFEFVQLEPKIYLEDNLHHGSAKSVIYSLDNVFSSEDIQLRAETQMLALLDRLVKKGEWAMASKALELSINVISYKLRLSDARAQRALFFIMQCGTEILKNTSSEEQIRRFWSTLYSALVNHDVGNVIPHYWHVTIPIIIVEQIQCLIQSNNISDAYQTLLSAESNLFTKVDQDRFSQIKYSQPPIIVMKSLVHYQVWKHRLEEDIDHDYAEREVERLKDLFKSAYASSPCFEVIAAYCEFLQITQEFEDCLSVIQEYCQLHADPSAIKLYLQLLLKLQPSNRIGIVFWASKLFYIDPLCSFAFDQLNECFRQGNLPTVQFVEIICEKLVYCQDETHWKILAEFLQGLEQSSLVELFADSTLKLNQAWWRNCTFREAFMDTEHRGICASILQVSGTRITS